MVPDYLHLCVVYGNIRFPADLGSGLARGVALLHRAVADIVVQVRVLLCLFTFFVIYDLFIL